MLLRRWSRYAAFMKLAMNLLPIRVMTFNIFHSDLEEDEIEHFSDIWANRADFSVKTVMRYAPDVICLQEFTRHIHGDTYERQFPEYGSIVTDDHGESIGTVIFWRSARFECLDSGTFWLGPNPEERAAAWGAGDPLTAFST
jgi:mRNA deadenylase 3'-5' endonuclease subunit Ccr4